MMKLLLTTLCLLTVICSQNLFAETENMNNLPERKVIILLGPPGSGKGTQAKKLTVDLGIPHISTGDIIRDNIKSGTTLGKKFQEYTNAGKLVPDTLIYEILFDRLQQPDSQKGYILDGMPRTIPQAETLEQYFKKTMRNNPIVINLEVSDEPLVKRLAGRLTCKNCGNIQNKFFTPPKIDNKCDKCGSELIQRPDDREDVVKERLRVYHSQTQPLIDFYKQKGLLNNLDAEQESAEVYVQILKLTK